MTVPQINSVYYLNRSASVHQDTDNRKEEQVSNVIDKDSSTDSVSFKGSSNFANRGWYAFKKISEYMKKPSEITNNIIVAVGTGLIAPFAIMCSPSKKTHNVAEEKNEKEKKKFQAFRQPISALLAFGFQAPTTFFIQRGFDKLAYEKHSKIFNDKEFGSLIPTQSEGGYLRRQAKRFLQGKSVNGDWSAEMQKLGGDAKLIQELKDMIKADYAENNIEVSEEKLSKLAEKRLLKYKAEKLASIKHDSLLDEKVKELTGKINIEEKADIEFVTDRYKDLAKQRHKAEFDALRKDAKLSPFDKFIELMGLKNKKIKELESKQSKLAKEKGLELLKKEEPDIFKNTASKLKKYIENLDGSVQKRYENKKFWLNIGINLVMVIISCSVLNWLHPKFVNFMENRSKEKEAKKNGIEVSA